MSLPIKLSDWGGKKMDQSAWWYLFSPLRWFGLDSLKINQSVWPINKTDISLDDSAYYLTCYSKCPGLLIDIIYHFHCHVH